MKIQQILLDTNLNSNEKVIFLLLQQLSFVKGRAYPSVSYIQTKLNLSRPTVIYTIENLQKKGYLIKKYRECDNTYHTNLYILPKISTHSDFLKKNKELLSKLSKGISSLSYGDIYELMNAFAENSYRDIKSRKTMKSLITTINNKELSINQANLIIDMLK